MTGLAAWVFPSSTKLAMRVAAARLLSQMHHPPPHKRATLTPPPFTTSLTTHSLHRRPYRASLRLPSVQKTPSLRRRIIIIIIRSVLYVHPSSSTASAPARPKASTQYKVRTKLTTASQRGPYLCRRGLRRPSFFSFSHAWAGAQTRPTHIRLTYLHSSSTHVTQPPS